MWIKPGIFLLLMSL